MIKIDQYKGFESYSAELCALDNLHEDFTERSNISMYSKLRKKYREGYGGWDNPSCRDNVLKKLRKNIEDKDWVDVANCAMFLWNIDNNL